MNGNDKSWVPGNSGHGVFGDGMHHGGARRGLSLDDGDDDDRRSLNDHRTHQRNGRNHDDRDDRSCRGRPDQPHGGDSGRPAGRVGTGPVEPVLETLESAFGSPEGHSGWGPNECAGGATTRSVFWANLSLYLEEVAGAEVLAGYTYDSEQGSAAPGEVIELPEGIVFGMPYGEGADLYPEGTYTHATLELDGIMFESPHPLVVIAATSPDHSAPIRQVWVGPIPTCR